MQKKSIVQMLLIPALFVGALFFRSQPTSAAIVSLPIPASSTSSCRSLNLGVSGYSDITLGDIDSDGDPPAGYRTINPAAGWLMDASPNSPAVYSCMDFSVPQCLSTKLNSVTLSGSYTLGADQKGVNFDGQNGFLFGFVIDGQTLNLNYSGPYAFTNMEPLAGNDGLPQPATSPDIFEKTFYVGRPASSFSVAMLNLEPSDDAPGLLDSLGVKVDYEDSSCSSSSSVNIPSAPKTGLQNSSTVAIAVASIAGFLVIPLASLASRRVRL